MRTVELAEVLVLRESGRASELRARVRGRFGGWVGVDLLHIIVIVAQIGSRYDWNGSFLNGGGVVVFEVLLFLEVFFVNGTVFVMSEAEGGHRDTMGWGFNNLFN